MDHALLMRMLNGSADVNKQLQTPLCLDIISVAIVCDGRALDQFHGKVRPASFGRTGFEYLGDVGMIHHRQGLTFGLEAGDDPFGIHTEFDDLDRHPAANGFFLFSHIDGAKAAFAYQFKQLVRPNDRAGTFVWEDSPIVI